MDNKGTKGIEYPGFKIEKLQKGLWAIEDEKGNFMYLIEGDEKALLIDTGIMPVSIRAMIQDLTEKPVELALTHAHCDHIYHADEFDRVYIHAADQKAWSWPMKYTMMAGCRMFKVKQKSIRVRDFTPLREGDEIRLGGNNISLISVPGHTPGSCVYADRVHKALFMGDAVGNDGVWLWLPESRKVGIYKRALAHLLQKMRPYKDYLFLGGHRIQSGQLNAEIVRDMYLLCKQVLHKEVKPVKIKFGMFHLIEYRYRKACIWTVKGKAR